MKLPNDVVLAARDDCLEVSRQAMALFDSLENGELTFEGAKAAAQMAHYALGIREAFETLTRAATLMHPGRPRDLRRP